MPDIKKLISSLTFLLFITIAALSLPERSYSATWMFLKDISGVGLFFENLTRHRNDLKLNTDVLYRNSSKRFGEANIRIFRDSQWKNHWGGAFVKIKIISSKFTETDRVAVYVDFAVYRPVVIFGGTVNQNEAFNSTSWSTGKLFSCTQEEYQGCVQNGVNDLIDLFIKDFKVVNGEK